MLIRHPHYQPDRPKCFRLALRSNFLPPSEKWGWATQVMDAVEAFYGEHVKRAAPMAALGFTSTATKSILFWLEHLPPTQLKAATDAHRLRRFSPILSSFARLPGLPKGLSTAFRRYVGSARFLGPGRYWLYVF